MKTFTMELRTGIAEFVLIENQDGSQLTMFKSVYDEMIAQQEHLTEKVADSTEE